MWLTTKQIAERYGVTSRRILSLAKSREIKGNKIGRMRVWTEDEARRLKPRQRGNPGHGLTILKKKLQDELDYLIQKADEHEQTLTKQEPV